MIINAKDKFETSVWHALDGGNLVLPTLSNITKEIRLMMKNQTYFSGDDMAKIIGTAPIIGDPAYSSR